MEPSEDGVGDAPLSCTKDGVSELCRVAFLWPFGNWSVLDLWSPGFDMLDELLATSRDSSSSGMTSRRSDASSSSSSSDDEAGLSRFAV